jgi:phage terminase Nu1 subunit (DNA packaging protein)
MATLRAGDLLPLVTRPQLAACLGVHAITISKWEAHDGLPVAQAGGPGRASLYDLPKVIAWYLAREKHAAKPEGSLDLDTERARQASMQARRTELEIRKREGQLVEADMILAAWTEILTAVRTTLLAMPTASAEDLVVCAEKGPRAVEAFLRERIGVALTEAADWRPARQ